MIGVDFETFSDKDLRSVNTANYVDSPNFQPLLCSVAREGMPTVRIDFTEDYDRALAEFYGQVILPVKKGEKIAAHNAGFERAVMRRMGYDLPALAFVDSAVVSRALGYGSSLEAAAPQMLGMDKIETGKDLIMLFCVPQSEDQTRFDPGLKVANHWKWDEFGHYCDVDAELSLMIAKMGEKLVPEIEYQYQALTMDMNLTGWPVDVNLAREMEKQFRWNSNELLEEFKQRPGCATLNLNSHKQLTEWCAERGIKAKSFDEKHVAKMLKQLKKRIESPTVTDEQAVKYMQVVGMLLMKQELGGSSLKKLKVILDQVSIDGRLRYQYVHLGAGATWRCTSKGVQVQNLPRLYGGGADMSLVKKYRWTNKDLAANLRQAFAAHHPQGQLFIGDFASVESRGLAWQANESWKLEEYRRGGDVYAALGSSFFNVARTDVTGEQRTFGKVGELSCGYGAGPGAVRSFAEGMGVEMTEQQAVTLVTDWRKANPETVRYWHDLQDLLERAMSFPTTVFFTGRNMQVSMTAIPAPDSLCKQVGDPELKSLRLSMYVSGQVTPFLIRYIHGVHRSGRNWGYFKPSERKTGDLWNSTFTDPKTGTVKPYTLYGGKLAGLLTQSLCREIFYLTLSRLSKALQPYSNVKIFNQFHDEIGVEWQPDPFDPMDERKQITSSYLLFKTMENIMSDSPLVNFPMRAEVKQDHRYTK